MLRNLSVAVASGLVASAALMASPQALAGEERPSRIVLRDPARDVWGRSAYLEEPTKVGAYPPADVRRVVIAHRPEALVVRMRFADLRRVGWQYYPVTIYTPESWFLLVLISEPGRRGGYQSHESEHGVGCPLVKGQIPKRYFSHEIDYANDVVTMRIARQCLFNPRWARVIVQNSLATGATVLGPDWDQLYLDDPQSTRLVGRPTQRIYPG